MANLQAAIPVLHVANIARAVDFYTKRLGFTLGFAHGAGPALEDPCYCGLSRDDVWLHLSSFPGDRQSPAAALFVVEDVDALHAEFAQKGAPVDSDHPVDQTWGTRETFFRDPDGFSVCFQQRECKDKQA